MHCILIANNWLSHLFRKNISALKYSGECLPEVAFCYGGNEASWNSTMIKQCEKMGCFTCKDVSSPCCMCKMDCAKYNMLQVCHQREECFDMSSRKDPTKIGTDEFGNPVLTYYECIDGYCSEIYDLTCERRCNEE